MENNQKYFRKCDISRFINTHNRYKELGLTYEYLKEEYIVKNRTLQSLSNEFKCKIGLIRTSLIFYGLKKSKGKITENIKNQMKITGSTPRKMTPEYLEQLRKAQLKSTEAGKRNMDKRLASEGITYETLHNLYIVENKSLKDLCEIFDKKKSNIRKLLNRFNVPAKTQEMRNEIKLKKISELYEDEERVREMVDKTHSTIRERYSDGWYFNNSSKEETAVFEFVKTFLKDEVEIINGDYSVICKPNTNISLQLDIYIPDLKIAIEYNGEHYHDRKVYENDLKNNTILSREHLKTMLCKEKDIELLHVWSSDWLKNNEYTKSIIIDFLNNSVYKNYQIIQ